MTKRISEPNNCILYVDQSLKRRFHYYGRIPCHVSRDGLRNIHCEILCPQCCLSENIYVCLYVRSLSCILTLSLTVLEKSKVVMSVLTLIFPSCARVSCTQWEATMAWRHCPAWSGSTPTSTSGRRSARWANGGRETESAS